MRKVFILTTIIFLTLGACSKKQDTSKQKLTEEEIPKLVLQINNAKFTLSDFEAYLLGKKLDLKELDDATKSALFNDYVDSRLLLVDAEAKKIILNSDEIAFYRKGLEELNVTVDAPVLKSIYENLLISKYLKNIVFKGIKVTDNEAYKYYKEHPNEFYRPERVKVHQILLDSEDKALLIREKLKNASHNEFEKLAKQYSTAPESKKGGDMGWYEKGDLPSDMENVIFSLNPGQVSQVVKTALGYHIFRLDRKEKARMLTFPEVRDRIKRKLLEEKRDKALNDWLTKLKHEYKVKIYEENLGFPYSKEE